MAALVTLLGEPKVRGTWREQVEEKPVVPQELEELLGGILWANGGDVAVVGERKKSNPASFPS